MDGDRVAAAALPAIGLGVALGDRPFDDAALPHQGRREAADRHPHSPANALVGRRPAAGDVGRVPAPLQDLGVLVELVAVVGNAAHAAQQGALVAAGHLAQPHVEFLVGLPGTSAGQAEQQKGDDATHATLRSRRQRGCVWLQ